MRGLSFIFMVVGVALCDAPAQADVIELRSSEWCPYSCAEDSAYPGYMVELAQAALTPYGHEVRYRVQTWSRSLAEVQSGAIAGVVGTDSYEAPTLRVGVPLGVYQEALVFRAGEARDITGEADLDGLRLGVIQDYDYETVTGDYIATHERDPSRVQLLSGEDALVRNLKKLLAGRVDLVLEDRAVLMFTLQRLDLDQSQFDITLQSVTSDLFIGFSPQLDQSDTYNAQLAEGLRHLRQSGRYGEILARYGLED